MVTVWMDESERDAFQTLCKTTGVSGSSVLRRWILTAIQQQTTEFVAASPNHAPSEGSGTAVPPEMLKDLMQRLASLEKAMPKFNEDDLVEMRQEILSGESGSMRYRMGIVEAQLQSLGGSIAWKSEPAKNADSNRD